MTQANDLNQKPIKTLSLFTGAGGLDIGFHTAGYEIVACIEINETYCRTLRENIGADKFFGTHPVVICQDVNEFDTKPFEGIGIECVIGGPPCQSFSAAGRRSGGVVGIRDHRGSLFQRYCEILDRIRPRAFIFENVYGLTGANGGASWRAIASAFSELGYVLRCEVLDAADYGVPQHRERLILVGSKEEEFEFPLPTHGPDSDSGRPLMSVLEAIVDLQDEREPHHSGLGGLYGHLLPEVPEGLNYAFFTAEMGHPRPVFAWRSKFHDLLYKVDRHRPSRTIKAQPGKFTGPFHWKNRHFTAQELRRLQTFPDNYVVTGTYGKVVEQIGNSVPPRLAEVLAISLKEQLLRKRGPYAFPIRPFGFQSTFRQRQRDRTHHFRNVAQKEFSRRRPPSSKAHAARVSEDNRYFVSAAGQFSRARSSKRPARNPAEIAFQVSVKEAKGAISIEIKRTSYTRRRLVGSIEISGLSKYLGRIERLNCNFRIGDPSDLFHVWCEIEASLTSRSEFFTLIDIYGHYANRGDTVKIITKFSPRSPGNLPVQAALLYFGSSENCGAFLSLQEMAATIGITKRDVPRTVQALRELRFDVRTHETHPIIEAGRVICTYPFPLLSAKAMVESKVQLIREKVEEAVGEYLVSIA
jgi:DNA (cytosine-5)-methyltransferase 1